MNVITTDGLPAIELTDRDILVAKNGDDLAQKIFEKLVPTSANKEILD